MDKQQPNTIIPTNYEAYMDGYMAGVKFCQKYGIPSDLNYRNPDNKAYTGKEPENISTDNTDVACLSLNDVMEIVRGLGGCTTGKDNRSYINSMLYRKVKQKLNK